jgi:PST family polysaccharide transporter
LDFKQKFLQVIAATRVSRLFGDKSAAVKASASDGVLLFDPAANAEAAPPSTLGAKAAGGALWAMLEGAVSQAIALVGFIVIARYSEPRYFGIVAAALALAEGLRLAFIESFAVAMIADRDSDKDDWNAAFWICALGGAVLGLCLWLAAPALAALFKESELAHVLPAIAWTLFVYGLARAPEAWLLRHMRFKPLALRSVLGASAGAMAGIAAAMSGMGLQALILQQVIASAVACAVVWAATRWRPALTFHPERLKRQGKYAAKLSPSSVAYFLSQNLDVLIITAAAGATTSGVYNVAKRVRLATLIVFGGLGRVALTSFAALRDMPDQLAWMVTRAAGVTVLVTGPICVAVSALSPEVVELLFGERWASTAPALSLLMLGVPLFILNDYFEQVILARGRPLWVAPLKGGYIVALTGAVAAASQSGIAAIAAASLTVSVLLLPVTGFCASRLAPISGWGFIRAIGAPLTGCAAMAYAIHLVRPLLGDAPFLFRIAALGAVGLLAYSCVIALFARNSALAAIATLRAAVTRRATN